jgi:hypothetical protein
MRFTIRSSTQPMPPTVWIGAHGPTPGHSAWSGAAIRSAGPITRWQACRAGRRGRQGGLAAASGRGRPIRRSGDQPARGAARALSIMGASYIGGAAGMLRRRHRRRRAGPTSGRQGQVARGIRAPLRGRSYRPARAWARASSRIRASLREKLNVADHVVSAWPPRSTARQRAMVVPGSPSRVGPPARARRMVDER